MKYYCVAVLALALSACGEEPVEAENVQAEDIAMEQAEAEPAASEVSSYETIGAIETYDPRGEAILPAGTQIEKLTDDLFRWSEGPVWIADGDYLLFSDVPENTIYQWSEEGGIEVFMQPSGYDGPETDIFREPGTNGLIPAAEPGAILIADHGNRMIARLDLDTKEKTPLATEHDGKKFSSPNDLTLASDGTIYFTDPPYGLAGIDDSPAKEMAFNGVYRYTPSEDGGYQIDVIDAELTRPNGVILSPDESVLYVAQSDPQAAKIFRYTLGEDGLPTSREEFANMTQMLADGMAGNPDGMAVDTNGNLYATGPGGVHVFAPDGTRLALISTGTAAANVTFGGDGSMLYITSGAFLARVPVEATGAGF